MQVVAVARVRWWSLYCQFSVSARTLLGRLLWRCRATSQTPPVISYAILHRCSCCCCSRSWICSSWRLVQTASAETPRVPSWISGDGETCEVRRLFADGFVCEGLHCDPILCACWHDGSETVALITLRATLSGSCLASTASKQFTPIQNCRSTRISASVFHKDNKALGSFPGVRSSLLVYRAQRDTSTSTRRACSSTRHRHDCPSGPYRP